MATMQESPVQDPSNPFLPLARRLGRSPILRPLIQGMGAILVLTISLVLAARARENPDAAAKMLAELLVAVGGLLAWNFLPFPGKTRARLAASVRHEGDRRVEDSWARVFRAGLWLGPFILLSTAFDEFWKTGGLPFPTSKDLIPAGMIFAIGLIAHWRNRGQ